MWPYFRDLEAAEGENPSAYDQEMLTDFRMAEIAPFSNRETWAWEMPKLPATSIWVLPS